MAKKSRKAVTVESSTPPARRRPDEARDRLAAAMSCDVDAGALRLFDERYVLLRPEVLANIQKQLEQTVGASTKGFLYLAGERSAEERLHAVRGFDADFDMDRDFEGTSERAIEAVAMTGWGRYEVLVFDRGTSQGRIALENSPLAEAYGPSSKPVCHLVAGWIAGAIRRVFGREVLCEEVLCKAQGRPRCEFEVSPMPAAFR